jgi:hypothetical protein
MPMRVKTELSHIANYANLVASGKRQISWKNQKSRSQWATLIQANTPQNHFS